MLAMRPGPEEYGAFYAGYIGQVPDGALLARLQAQPSEYRVALAAMGEGPAALPMAAGKWSVVDVIGHVTDTERVFGFRLLWFARGETSPLPGFDQDAWVQRASRTTQTLTAGLDALAAVRTSTLSLLETLPDEVADRSGLANGQRMTVRALAWMLAGHAQHHLEALRRLGLR